VRDLRLFLVGLLPNVLPMSFALGFMALAGISLRIGTAMVLAIALGIAIDDTIHVLVRLRRESRAGRAPGRAVEETCARTGRAVVATTLILVLGFATFVPSRLLALRDMGVVGMLTLAVALFADLALAPALFLLWPERQSKKRSSSRAPSR
jgi:hypothetical protein